MFEEKTREDRRRQCLRNKAQFSIPMEMPAPGKCKGYQMSTEKMYAKAEIPCCDEKEVHVDKVRYVNENMPPEDKLYDLAELFKAFGDSTRIRILFALFEEEICVCDLAESLNMTQSAVSHQLRLLKQARLVNGRREGKQIIYYLADDHVRTIISMGLEHINE